MRSGESNGARLRAFTLRRLRARGPRGGRMNFESYTERAQGFVQAAQTIALREGHQQFTPEHLLKVLLDDPEGLAAGLIDRAGGNARQAQAATSTPGSPSCRKCPAQPRSRRRRATAARLRHRREDRREGRRQFVTVERLLLRSPSRRTARPASILGRAGVTPQALNAGDQRRLRKGRTADTRLGRAGL